MRNRIGRGIKGLLAVLGGAAIVMGAIAPMNEAEAQGSIKNTRHNLGTSPRVPAIAGANTFSGTDEVCVFCHTPHGAATGTGMPPLWNRTLPAGPYTVYDTTNSSTLDGRLANDGLAGSPSVGSVSIACLSCHDGSQALSSVINAPGSGLTTTAYSAGTWTSGTGTMPVAGNLGTNLSNDHPIGIQYCGGGPTVALPGTGCRDSDFIAPTSAVIGAGLTFWVETTGSGVGRQKSDMILFNRTFPVDGIGPSVECATCHDVHKDGAATGTTMFLRISNTASNVCLACHVK